jgi:epoxyqueuosine reductase QueG
MEDSERMITVCDSCLRACCWQGIIMCDEAKDAGTVEKSVSELKQLNFESSDYWCKESQC